MRTSEYTSPLVGTPYYESTGIIRVFDAKNRFFNVGEVSFQRFDEQNFQYVFRPYWTAIESLPEGLFQGFAGIDLSTHKEEYYRVNMTPSFISMRTPSEARENVKELMASVGLDYYDRFEWLLRTESRCGDDNLIVVRKPSRAAGQVRLAEFYRMYTTPADEIVIPSMDSFQGGHTKLLADVYQLLQCGSRLYIECEKRYIGEEERKTMLYLVRNLLACSDRDYKEKREEGIRSAKEQGKYKGRKPIAVDKDLLNEVAREFSNHHISEKTAMERLGITSRSTFYRKLKNISITDTKD